MHTLHPCTGWDGAEGRVVVRAHAAHAAHSYQATAIALVSPDTHAVVYFMVCMTMIKSTADYRYGLEGSARAARYDEEEENFRGGHLLGL